MANSRRSYRRAANILGGLKLTAERNPCLVSCKLLHISFHSTSHKLKPEFPTIYNFRTERSFSGQQTIITVVLKNGDTTETVPIHKSFICYYSPYFNATFNGNFAEGDTQCVELEDAPPVAFNLFVKWLYTQDIAEEEMDLLNGDNTNLVDAWILADRFIVPRLQNQLLWSMSSRRGKVSFESCIRAYEKTAPGSKLRSYIIDRTIYDITTEPDHRPIGEGFSKMFPREMLDDLFYGFLVRYQQRPDSQAIQQNITK
jgi:hypothetical protein